MSWFTKQSYNLVKKIFSAEIQKDIAVEVKGANTVKDVFGEHLSAIHFTTFPPATYGTTVVEPEDILKRYEPVLRKTKRYARIEAELFDKSKPTFETLYYNVLLNYTRFVHLVPASESHHHNEVGGLIRHSIQVAEKTLKDVNQKVLEVMFQQDVEKGRKDKWYYAAWLCGLLHDAGKAYANLKVISMDNKHTWEPHKESLVDWAKNNNVRKYRVEHITNRLQHKHEPVGAHILNQVLTEQAREYIISSPDDLMHEISQTINNYGTTKSYLADSVRAADVASTTKDMITIYDKELGPKKASVAEMIIKAFRELSKTWSYNKPKSRVLIMNDAVWLKWPDAFSDARDWLQNQRVNVPATPQMIIQKLEECGLVDYELLKDYIRDGKTAPYALVLVGDYDGETIAKQIETGSSGGSSNMYVPMISPDIVFGREVVPHSTPGYVKTTREWDVVNYRKNGEVETYNYQDFVEINPSSAQVMTKQTKKAKAKVNSKRVVSSKIEVDTSAVLKKDDQEAASNSTAKQSSILTFNNTPEQKPQSNTNAPTSNKHETNATVTSGQKEGADASKPKQFQASFIPESQKNTKVENEEKNGTPRKITPDQKPNKVNATKLKKMNPTESVEYPWKKATRRVEQVDKHIHTIIEKIRTELSLDEVRSVLVFQNSRVGMSKELLSRLIPDSANLFIAESKKLKYLEDRIDGTSLYKYPVDVITGEGKTKKEMPCIVFCSDVSLEIIRRTNIKSNRGYFRVV